MENTYDGNIRADGDLAAYRSDESALDTSLHTTFTSSLCEYAAVPLCDWGKGNGLEKRGLQGATRCRRTSAQALQASWQLAHSPGLFR